MLPSYKKDIVNSILDIQRLVLVNLQVLHGEEGGQGERRKTAFIYKEVESDANAGFPFPRFPQASGNLQRSPVTATFMPGSRFHISYLFGFFLTNLRIAPSFKTKRTEEKTV